MKVILSRYKEDVSWIKEYNFDYIIYNKGDHIDGYNIIQKDNIGGNQRDIFEFIIDNYNNLPDHMLFLQAYPFDHCNKEKFDKIINNKCFTPIESYEHIPVSNVHIKGEDGGYCEINNNWYITSHNQTYNLTCKFNSFDSFMTSFFKNYNHIDWIRFTPGSQYLITKEQALQYPVCFWQSLMNILSSCNSTEAHIIERALYIILECKYILQDWIK